MGIGLSISRTIIEAHGGRLWASQIPAGGTIFRLTLKVVESRGHRWRYAVMHLIEDDEGVRQGSLASV